MTTCRLCHRQLKTPESRKRGAGPVCAKKLLQMKGDKQLSFGDEIQIRMEEK